MERVQFEQEQMLPELKDLVHKGLFSTVEVKQIFKKRTHFEAALVRRVPKKSDFLRYAAYEMGLEQLRRRRLQRLSLEKAKATISDYALVRRQFQIFERALKRFKSDVGLWTQYIQVAKREGARALVGRITARALQLHPHTPAFYILAASHELSHMSPSAARSLLQRGLRLNSDSVEMWREYIRMELGFIEGMRRRWDVLGINKKDKEMQMEERVEADIVMDDIGESAVIDDQAEKPPNEVVTAEKDDDEGEAARGAIMDGAIVKSALSEAVKALPTIKLFTELETLIHSYPCQHHLRTSLLDYFYLLLQVTLPNDPRAIQMHATRRLRELTSPKEDGKDTVEGDLGVADNEKLINALQFANEQLAMAVKASLAIAMKSDTCAAAHPTMSEIYANFISEWCRSLTLDSNLKQYLIGSLQALAQDPSALPVLQATHVRLLLRHGTSPKRTLKVARKYSAAGTSASVWLARLEAENACAQGDANLAWASARKAVDVSQDADGAEKVWLWGLGYQSSNAIQQTVYKDLLNQSMQDSAARKIHETLLFRYVSDVIYSQENNSTMRLRLIRDMSNAYLLSAAVWDSVFTLECARDNLADKSILGAVYDYWRPLDLISATSAWARWLMDHKEGKVATQLITSTSAQLGSEDKRRFIQVLRLPIIRSLKNDDDDDDLEVGSLPLTLEHVVPS